MGETIFRLSFILIFLIAFGISGYFRRRARGETGTIPRGAEGPRAILGRLLITLPLAGSILLYAIRPEWMDWASFGVPASIRWLGVLIGALIIPFLVWVLQSIGSNISETVLIKEEHILVTHGPYRWIRHPLYTAGSMLIFSLGLIAGSWLMLLFWIVAVTVFRLVVIPAEEANLIAAFGDSYRDYRRSTGAMVPKLWSEN